MWHNINAFFCTLALVILLEMALSRYSKSILTSLERELHLSGKQLGLLGSAQQIGDLSFCLVVSYFGAHRNRPKYLGVGCLIMVFGAMLSAFPHLLIPTHSTSFISLAWKPTICKTELENNSSLSLDSSVEKIKTYTKNTNLQYYGLVMSGLVLFGIGMSPLKPLGFSYLDDHTNGKRSALYIGAIAGTYYAGPVLGFLVSAWTTNIWVDISTPKSLVSDIDPRNPQWISAWWLGFVIFAVLLLASGLPFFCFPRKMNSSDNETKIQSNESSNNEEETKSFSIKEVNSEAQQNSLSVTEQEKITKPYQISSIAFKQASDNSNIQNQLNEKTDHLTTKQHFSKFISSGKILLSNRYFVLNVLGSTFLWFYVSVYSVFIIKYVEQQFSLTASKSNVLFGLIPTPFTVLGTVIGGLIINRCNLSLAGIFRLALVSTALGTITHCIGFFSIFCDTAMIEIEANSSCQSQACFCPNQFEPVCAGGVTYSSACLIGCKNYTFNLNTKIYNFSSCSCLPNVTAVAGICLSNCKSEIIWFIIIISVGTLLFGITSSSSLIAIIRILARENKSFGLGITLVCNKLLGAIPGPIIAGAIIDRACKYHLKRVAVCAVYDLSLLRVYFGALLFILKVLTVVIYAICSFLSRKEPSTQSTLSGKLKSSDVDCL